MIRFAAANEHSRLTAHSARSLDQADAQEANARGLYESALELHRQQSFEAAVDAYTEVLAVPLVAKADAFDPNERRAQRRTATSLKYSALKNRAACRVKTADLASAAADFADALDVDGSDVAVWLSFASCCQSASAELGHSFMHLEKYALERALACRADHPFALCDLAEVSFRLGDPVSLDAAVDALTRHPHESARVSALVDRLRATYAPDAPRTMPLGPALAHVPRHYYSPEVRPRASPPLELKLAQQSLEGLLRGLARLLGQAKSAGVWLSTLTIVVNPDLAAPLRIEELDPSSSPPARPAPTAATGKRSASAPGSPVATAPTSPRSPGPDAKRNRRSSRMQEKQQSTRDPRLEAVNGMWEYVRDPGVMSALAPVGLTDFERVVLGMSAEATDSNDPVQFQPPVRLSGDPDVVARLVQFLADRQGERLLLAVLVDALDLVAEYYHRRLSQQLVALFRTLAEQVVDDIEHPRTLLMLCELLVDHSHQQRRPGSKDKSPGLSQRLLHFLHSIRLGAGDAVAVIRALRVLACELMLRGDAEREASITLLRECRARLVESPDVAFVALPHVTKYSVLTEQVVERALIDTQQTQGDLALKRTHSMQDPRKVLDELWPILFPPDGSRIDPLKVGPDPFLPDPSFFLNCTQQIRAQTEVALLRALLKVQRPVAALTLLELLLKEFGVTRSEAHTAVHLEAALATCLDLFPIELPERLHESLVSGFWLAVRKAFALCFSTLSLQRETAVIRASRGVAILAVCSLQRILSHDRTSAAQLQFAFDAFLGLAQSRCLLSPHAPAFMRTLVSLLAVCDSQHARSGAMGDDSDDGGDDSDGDDDDDDDDDDDGGDGDGVGGDGRDSIRDNNDNTNDRDHNDARAKQQVTNVLSNPTVWLVRCLDWMFGLSLKQCLPTAPLPEAVEGLAIRECQLELSDVRLLFDLVVRMSVDQGVRRGAKQRGEALLEATEHILSVVGSAKDPRMRLVLQDEMHFVRGKIQLMILRARRSASADIYDSLKLTSQSFQTDLKHNPGRAESVLALAYCYKQRAYHWLRVPLLERGRKHLVRASKLYARGLPKARDTVGTLEEIAYLAYVEHQSIKEVALAHGRPLTDEEQRGVQSSLQLALSLFEQVGAARPRHLRAQWMRIKVKRRLGMLSREEFLRACAAIMARIQVPRTSPLFFELFLKLHTVRLEMLRGPNPDLDIIEATGYYEIESLQRQGLNDDADPAVMVQRTIDALSNYVRQLKSAQLGYKGILVMVDHHWRSGATDRALDLLTEVLPRKKRGASALVGPLEYTAWRYDERPPRAIRSAERVLAKMVEVCTGSAQAEFLVRLRDRVDVQRRGTLDGAAVAVFLDRWSARLAAAAVAALHRNPVLSSVYSCVGLVGDDQALEALLVETYASEKGVELPLDQVMRECREMYPKLRSRFRLRGGGGGD